METVPIDDVTSVIVDGQDVSIVDGLPFSNGKIKLIRTHMVAQDKVSDYSALDIAKSLLDKGVPMKWVVEMHTCGITGKQLMAMIKGKWAWFRQMGFRDYGYLSIVETFVENAIKVEKDNNTGKPSAEIGTTDNKTGEIGKKNKIEKKKVINVPKDLSYVGESLIDETSESSEDSTGIDWTLGLLQICKAVQGIKVKDMDWKNVIDNIDEYVKQLKKNEKKEFYKLMDCLIHYIVHGDNKFKSFPRYCCKKGTAFGIKKGYTQNTVVQGFFKIIKCYLAYYFESLFNRKLKGISNYNSKKVQFKRPGVELIIRKLKKKAKNALKKKVVYQYFQDNYGIVYDKKYDLESESEIENVIESLENYSFGNTGLKKKVNSSFESTGLTKEQITKGWYRVATPENEFSDSFFEKFITEFADGSENVFVQSRFNKKKVYFYDSKGGRYINIKNVNDILKVNNGKKDNKTPYVGIKPVEQSGMSDFMTYFF